MTTIAQKAATTRTHSHRSSRTPVVARNRPPAENAQRPAGPVAYIMSRFPKVTETFVLYEILAVEQTGQPVEVYPLLHERAAVVHPEAKPLVERAHFAPFVSLQIIRHNLHYLRRRPLAYLGALGALMRGTWGSPNFFLGGLAIFPKVMAFAKSMEAQGIIHIHAHFCNHPAAAAYLIHRVTGIPYSFTAHGSDLHRDRHMLPEKVSRAAFVATISEYNRNLIVSECNPSAEAKVSVVHCGVDTDAFRPAERPVDLPNASLDIVCVGTLHGVKGQKHLIEACRELHAQGLNVVCHLVGDGPDATRLAAQAQRLGVSKSIRFHGACTRSEVIALLRDADIVATPSVPTADGRREGIPVAIMEAMACGVPVVASRLSGIPELVEHEQNGLLVPPGDASALADALARLANDPALRKRLGANGRETVLKDFNLRNNAARLVAMFLHRPAERREEEPPQHEPQCASTEAAR